MAKGKKTGGKSFAEGHSHSKGKGRPALTKEDLKARELNKIELGRIINKYLYHSYEELNELVKSNTLTVIERIVVKLLSDCATNGDIGRFSFILDRMIGKVREEMAFMGPDGGPIQTQNETSFNIKSLSTQDLKTLKALQDKAKKK